MWKNLELSARKDLEDLIGHSRGSLEDQTRERNMDIEDLAHEISERNKDYIKNWDRVIPTVFWEKKYGYILPLYWELEWGWIKR